MAVSEPFRLTPTDSTEALSLSAEAGWNQTADDWRIFITHGATFAIRVDERIAATAAGLPYRGAFGFVGMVLTTAAQRHRGHATRLLALAVQALRETGHVPMLDATPDGRAVYEKHGFLPVDALQRWAGLAQGEPAPGAANAVAVAALDAVAFGAARRFLFDDLLAREATTCIVEPEGCVVARRGLRAIHVGPLVAASEAQALDLLHRMLARLAGPVLLDVPPRWHALTDFLTDRGFAVQRSFTRMALDHGAPFGDPARLFAVTGPEFG